MKILDVEAEAALSPGQIEQIFQELDLTVTLRGTLATHPGCDHWHVKQGKKSGTLEVTFLPRTGETWVSYHDNRVGDGWVVDAAIRLKDALEKSGPLA